MGLPLLALTSPQCWVAEPCVGTCWSTFSHGECGHSRHPSEARGQPQPCALP